MSETAELNNKHWMGAVIAEALSQKLKPAKQSFQRQVEECSPAAGLLTLSEAILLHRAARKTDWILRLRRANASAQTIAEQHIISKMARFLIFKGDDIFSENAVIAKQSPMCVCLKNSFP